MFTFEDICAQSRAQAPRIVLSEGEDPRVIEAATLANCEGIARVILVGDRDAIRAEIGGKERIEKIQLCDPNHSEKLDQYAHAFWEHRKHKGVTEEGAREAVKSPLSFAAMMVREGDADGTIGGVVSTTADTVRAALQIIGRAPGVDVVSSYFLMLLKEPFDRPVVFADCGLILQPNSLELADIAIASADSFGAITAEDPRVALLSFSTMGSVRADAHESIERIREAKRIVNQRRPDIVIDGEIQFDAAIVPDVSERKAPGSILGGHANVFVFPSLSAGNIGYKIAHRLGGATAVGPILQGLSHPANDLSRGCSVEDVYQMIAITGAQTASRATTLP